MKTAPRAWYSAPGEIFSHPAWLNSWRREARRCGARRDPRGTRSFRQYLTEDERRLYDEVLGRSGTLIRAATQDPAPRAAQRLLALTAGANAGDGRGVAWGGREAPQVRHMSQPPAGARWRRVKTADPAC